MNEKDKQLVTNIAGHLADVANCQDEPNLNMKVYLETQAWNIIKNVREHDYLQLSSLPSKLAEEIAFKLWLRCCTCSDRDSLTMQEAKATWESEGKPNIEEVKEYINLFTLSLQELLKKVSVLETQIDDMEKSCQESDKKVEELQGENERLKKQVDTVIEQGQLLLESAVAQVRKDLIKRIQNKLKPVDYSDDKQRVVSTYELSASDWQALSVDGGK